MHSVSVKMQWRAVLCHGESHLRDTSQFLDMIHSSLAKLKSISYTMYD